MQHRMMALLLQIASIDIVIAQIARLNIGQEAIRGGEHLPAAAAGLLPRDYDALLTLPVVLHYF